MPGDPVHEAIEQRLRTFDELRFGERLFARDTTLWKDDPEHREIIGNALGWLSVADDMEGKSGDLSGFAAQVAADGFTDAVLLGMGGSILAPEVLRRTFGVAEGFLDLHICDSTDPAAVGAVEAAVDLERTLFVVSSKSGRDHRDGLVSRLLPGPPGRAARRRRGRAPFHRYHRP